MFNWNNIIGGEEKYNKSKWKEQLLCKCVGCNKDFLRGKRRIRNNIYKNQPLYCSRDCFSERNDTIIKCDFCKKEFMRHKSKTKGLHIFCSPECQRKARIKRVRVECLTCKKERYLQPCFVKVRKFCSIECRDKYKGFYRSEFEKVIGKCLNEEYPNLEIKFNDRIEVGVELDILIPKLKLAFEINGPHHYRPIYGEQELQLVKTKDKIKLESCIKNNIQLFILDISTVERFRPIKVLKYLQFVTKIINSKLNPSNSYLNCMYC